MIASLLVANRGEIARRIIRTAKRMGVRALAVYSEADADAPHVREADAAILIGPAAASESYLVSEKILAAARQLDAAAIHPGYGFLSENAEFAEAVLAAGLTWVGAPPAAIRAMGLKDAAKKLMADAGVPVTPGDLGEDQDEAVLAAAAERIGFPVLIKAVAGGGGKGMRKVERAEDFAAALASCRREAAQAFRDDRVLLEKYVSRPRHIEVQVFADRQGQVVHLYERDCSLQRRHQKVIEEAPAPSIDATVRAVICGAAIRAARAVSYEGAGTVEFIADASQGLRPDRIWFMEMNTRLQVEHPVTEAVTGLDLVEWQLRIASGEPLPLTQDQIRLSGHACEARLYAENPATGFLPSTGLLTRFRLPEDAIRVDAGVQEGGEVSAFYDPMIAKLIAHGPDRTTAAAALARACRAVEVWPVKTNAAFLARCLDHAAFVAGAVDTGFIETHLDALVPAAAVPADAAMAAARALVAEQPDASPWCALTGFRMNAPASFEARLEIGGEVHVVLVDPAAPSPGLTVHRQDGHVVVFEAGEAFDFTLAEAAQAGREAAGDGAIRSPMPGKVVAVHAAPGQSVVKGQPLVTVEAMKMEHALTAPFDGTLAELAVKAGDQVGEGAMLARLET
jgi:acetyl/propionyl-CoA carboxylase alpha subunit